MRLFSKPINSTFCRSGEIGRRVGLKIRYPQGCVGSSPSFGTKLKTTRAVVVFFCFTTVCSWRDLCVIFITQQTVFAPTPRCVFVHIILSFGPIIIRHSNECRFLLYCKLYAFHINCCVSYNSNIKIFIV